MGVIKLPAQFTRPLRIQKTTYWYCSRICRAWVFNGVTNDQTNTQCRSGSNVMPEYGLYWPFKMSCEGSSVILSQLSAALFKELHLNTASFLESTLNRRCATLTGRRLMAVQARKRSWWCHCVLIPQQLINSPNNNHNHNHDDDNTNNNHDCYLFG